MMYDSFAKNTQIIIFKNSTADWNKSAAFHDESRSSARVNTDIRLGGIGQFDGDSRYMFHYLINFAQARHCLLYTSPSPRD